MRYFYDVLTTAIDNYGVRAGFNDLLHAANLFCIKPQVEDGEDISDGKITEYDFRTLVEYLGENF